MEKAPATYQWDSGFVLISEIVSVHSDFDVITIQLRSTTPLYLSIKENGVPIPDVIAKTVKELNVMVEKYHASK